MSIRAINWVIENFKDVSPKKVTPTMRHILIILANFAGDEDSSYPRQNTIARITGLSRACVNKNLSLMEELGLISAIGRKHANGATRSSEYTMHIGEPNTYDGPVPAEEGANDDDTEGVNQDDRGVAQDDTGGKPGLQRGVTDDDTYKNHHLDPPPEPKQGSRRKPRRTTTWPSDYREQFYGLYPKKVDKQNALKKLDKIYDEDKVEFETILAGLKRYIASMKDEPLKFMMAPTVFLNGERWEDEFEASRSKPPLRRGGFAI